MTKKELFDVTIIGGGPAGMFSAFYSGLREMKVKVIEYQKYLGGKVHVFPEKMIWDIGGLTPTPGAKVIEQFVEQGLTFDPEVVLETKVTGIHKNEEGHFVVETSKGDKHYSKAVILAIGGGILNPTKLTIEGAERYEVTNLHYVVKSLERFKDKVVMISGGGNAAIDWANELEPIAKKVYLTYRKDLLKGHEADVRKLENSSADLLLNTTIQKLIASDDHDEIKQVELLNNDLGTTQIIDVDEVIINHGFERNNELLKNSDLNVEITEYDGIAGSVNSETSVPGLFAAGDVLEHEGKLHLIAGAFQDAANAVNKAKQFIDPESYGHGRVSSHNDLFKEKNKELIKHLYAKTEA